MSTPPRGFRLRTGIRSVASLRVPVLVSPSPSPSPSRVALDTGLMIPVPRRDVRYTGYAIKCRVPESVANARHGIPRGLGSDTHGAHSARTAQRPHSLCCHVYVVLPTATAARNDTGTRVIDKRSKGIRWSMAGTRTVSSVRRRDVVAAAASHVRIPVRWRASTAGHRAEPRNTVAVSRAFHNVLRGRYAVLPRGQLPADAHAVVYDDPRARNTPFIAD